MQTVNLLRNRRSGLVARCGAIVTLFGALSLPGAFSAGADPQSPIVVKKLTYKAGDIEHFKLTMRIVAPTPNGDQTFNVVMQFKQTTKELKPTGEHVLLDEFEKARVSIGDGAGEGSDVMKSMPVVTLTAGADGAVTARYEGGTQSGNGELGGILQHLSLASDYFRPKKPVKTGDAWTFAFANVNRLVGAPKGEGEASLVGAEKVAGADTLKVRIHGSGGGTAPTNAIGPWEGFINIEPDTGRVDQLIQKGEGTFAGGPAKVDMKIVRLTAADLKEAK